MRKTMLIVFLLAFLLQPIPGQAAQAYYTIGEMRENLPERWTQTYETKWRTIDIDVQPAMPDVEKIPLLQVMQDLWNPKAAINREGWQNGYYDDFGLFGVEYGELNEKAREYKQAPFLEPPYDMDQQYGDNNDLTLGDTIEQLKIIMSKLGEAPDAWRYDSPEMLMLFTCVDEETGKPLFPEMYSYSMKQQLHGIPILSHVIRGIDNPRSQEPGFSKGHLLFQIISKESWDVVGTKAKVIEIVAEDVPLCDFSVVQATLEKEIQDGHIRKIFHLELGYVFYTTPDPALPLNEKTLVLYAVPTWQVNCFYMASGKKEMSDHSNPNVTPIAMAQMEYKTVFVNAQTGKVIDRMDNRKGCGNYQGFISWEDVGGKR